MQPVLKSAISTSIHPSPASSRTSPQAPSSWTPAAATAPSSPSFRTGDWQLHGSDLSPTGIELARKTHPNINFFLADGQSLYAEFLDTVGPVDVVISTEVIEHVYDPRGFLRNCFALLKPGGTIVLTTPYHGYLKNLLLAATGKMDQHFTVLWDHGHIKFWSRKTIEEVLKETGFTNIEFAGSGRIPYVWKSMVLKATKPA